MVFMGEIYVEPVGLAQSLELYLEGKRLDKEIAQLVAIANNSNASLGDRRNAAIKLASLATDGMYTQLFDYVSEKKAFLDSAVSDTMSYLNTCLVTGLTDSNGAAVTIKAMVDDVLANKTTEYKASTHFDAESDISDFAGVSFVTFMKIVDNGVLLGYSNGKPLYGDDFGKQVSTGDGRTVVMTEHRTCGCNASYDLTVTGTASHWNSLRSTTAADASLTSKYC
jgi:hypothetical protein